MHANEPYHSIPVTQWSLVMRAGKLDGQEQNAALGELLRRYMPALRTRLVLIKKIPPDRADDLVQSFITEKLLEKNILQQASEQRGRFRNFLLTAMDNFILNQHRYESAKKRRPEDMTDIQDGLEPAASETNDAFETAWARQVLSRTIELMRLQCQNDHRPDIWGVFEARILVPLDPEGIPVTYEDLVTRYGFQSPAQASNVLVTAKRMYARILREVIGEYETDEVAIDEEFRDLRRILAKSAQ